MRFWITKNSEVPVREQLVRQVVLGILSEDFLAGHKLPSIRALARRHHIHSNTVSAAYHDLLERGWLELRRGSGLYVRSLQAPDGDASGLDDLLAGMLRAARRKGYEPEEVLDRLQHLILPRKYQRVVIVEAEPGMRKILLAEICEHLKTPVEAIEPSDLSNISDLNASLVAALPTRVLAVRKQLPRGTPCLMLRLRSVRASLEGQTAPPPNTIISVISGSPEFRYGARAMLIAAGIDPECMYEIDTTVPGWQERTSAGTLVIADVVAARDLPKGSQAKQFHLIADSSIAEIKQLCGN